MRRRALAAIFLANVLAGTSYLIQKLALEGLPPTTITLGRNLVALLGMWIWARSRGGIRLRTTKRETRLLFLLGNLSFAAPMLLGVIGVQLSTAANGSILILLEPGIILLLSWRLLREHVTPKQVLGVAVGLAGGLVIVLEDSPVKGLVSGEYVTGNVLLLLHGVLWGTYTPIARLLSRSMRAFDVTLISMLWSLVLLVPGTLIEVPQWRVGPELLPALGWIVVLGLLVTWLATFLWNYSVQTLSARTVAPFIFWQPVAGAASAWLVLGEELSVGAWIGTAIIATGVLLVIGGEDRLRPEPLAAAAERAGDDRPGHAADQRQDEH